MKQKFFNKEIILLAAVLVGFGFQSSVSARSKGALSFSNDELDVRSELSGGIGCTMMGADVHGSPARIRTMYGNLSTSYSYESGVFAGMELDFQKATTSSNDQFRKPIVPGNLAEDDPAKKTSMYELNWGGLTDVKMDEMKAALGKVEFAEFWNKAKKTPIEKMEVKGGSKTSLGLFLKVGYTYNKIYNNMSFEAATSAGGLLCSVYGAAGFRTMAILAEDMIRPSYVVNATLPMVMLGATFVSTETEGMGTQGAIEVGVIIKPSIGSFAYGGNWMATPGKIPDVNSERAMYLYGVAGAGDSATGGIGVAGGTADAPNGGIGDDATAQSTLPTETSGPLGTAIESIGLSPIIRGNVVPIRYTSDSGIYIGVKLHASVIIYRSPKVLTITEPQVPGLSTVSTKVAGIPVEMDTGFSITVGFQI